MNQISRIGSVGALRLACVLVGAGGIILIVGGVPGTGSTDWPVDVVGSGAGLVAAAVAGLVALRGVQTWREKQAEHAAAASRENRSRVYEQVLGHIVQSFTGGPPSDQEATVRAMAATWASSGLLQALADWFRYAERYSGEVPNKTYSYELIYRVALAMRSDIDPGATVSKDDLLRMIFNDYNPDKDNPPASRQVRVGQTGTVLGP